MSGTTEARIFDALATLSRACAEGGLTGEEGPVAAMNDEAREVLAEAALATSFGAFAARGGNAGVMPMLVATLGLLAVAAGEEPDPPAEILAITAEDARVEAEIDAAGEAVDREFGRESPPEAMEAALEARVLGSAITLAGCTLPEGAPGEGRPGQDAVRLRAARRLVRLAAGLVAMNAAGGAGVSEGPPPP